MSLDACARLVERGDPERFLAVMAARPAARARLLPLYAFNLEVARAPWVTHEPKIAEMRLQFWRDTLRADEPRAHEVAGPLHAMIRETGLNISLLERLIDVRLRDVSTVPFESAAEFDAYIEDTSAGLLWAAAQALGAPASAEAGLRALGWAAGLASYLRAVPRLTELGRQPLADPRPEAICALARKGLERLSRARQARSQFGAGADAALAGWLAGPVLERAAKAPERVAEGQLEPSEFTRRGRLLWMSATGWF